MIKGICGERGSNGYRRITAHRNRQLKTEQYAIARVNPKRVYHIMRQNELLLRKYTGRVGEHRVHDGQVITLHANTHWCSDGFKITCWYNYEYKHSQLNFVTPHQRHTGQDKAILAQRKLCMEAAKAANPSRWGKRDVRNYKPVGPTTLNPEKKSVKNRLLKREKRVNYLEKHRRSAARRAMAWLKLL